MHPKWPELRNRWSRHFAARELDCETEVQTRFLHLFGDFFSAGHFAAHERKFGRHLKEIFSELYRRFESPLVRQEVIDIIERIGRLGIYATFSTVTVLICESSQLRAQISPHFRDQRGQFSERHFANAVLVAMMVRSDLSLDAFVVDDVGQSGLLPADCRGQLIHHVRYRGARSLAENGRIEDQRPRARSEGRTVDI